jgi:hypothetical protein
MHRGTSQDDVHGDYITLKASLHCFPGPKGKTGLIDKGEAAVLPEREEESSVPALVLAGVSF